MGAATAAASRATMTAAVVASPGEVRLAQAPVPELTAGEILIRVEGCGVCGSNLPLWEGRPWFDYPLPAGAPGHEAWGRVEQVEPDGGGPAPGTRVAFLSDRSFAELAVARTADAVPLPAALDGTPFPGEALGCALNVLERSRIEAGDRVAVVGVGFLGLLLVQLAAGLGARVTALGRRPFALELAARVGAEETAALADAGEDASFDRVIEAAGVQETLDVATKLVRERGVLVVAGYHQDGLRQVDLQSWNWRGIDVVNAHERDPARYVSGIRRAVTAVTSGLLDPTPLYTHRYRLDELPAALDAARDRPEGFVKALVLT
jgi:threonine dehydrogenase-like Zn-dependent dehydrogenase